MAATARIAAGHGTLSLVRELEFSSVQVYTSRTSHHKFATIIFGERKKMPVDEDASQCMRL